MRNLALAAVLATQLCTLAACRRSEPPMRNPERFAATPPEGTTEGTTAGTPVGKDKPTADQACNKAEPAGPLRWFHDDYDGALACARARKVPLVVDLWAPWCHTCLSMQTTVFQEPELAPMAERFVFVALDTDREINARALGKLSIGAWPTFYVLASTDEAVQSRFVGAASKAQFLDFLAHGSRGAAPGSPADDLLRQGERAATIKDHAAAVTSYRAALAAAKADWSRRPDALVSLAGALRKTGDLAACLTLGESSLEDTGQTASATDFLVNTLDCAAGLAETERARVTAFRDKAAARLASLLDHPAAQLSVDDRSDAMMNLRTLQDALGRKDAARATATRQRALLDEAAAKAATPLAAMTYNWPRAEVTVYLGKGAELVADLEKSAAALPQEYDPPYRLAWTLWKSGRPEQAAAWCDKAVARAYGPRKARVLGLAADLAAERKDLEAERKARAAMVATYESLPPEQAAPEALAKAKEALAALEARAAGKPAAPAAK
ncbi:MAG: thioredoxin family protein [Myxococcales bacterium]|nr:thioredoxin family protein [Myxococcales bacterium]